MSRWVEDLPQFQRALAEAVRRAASTSTQGVSGTVTVQDGGGRILATATVGPSGTATIDMAALGAVLVTGDELVITAQVTAGSASQMAVTCTWEEII